MTTKELRRAIETPSLGFALYFNRVYKTSTLSKAENRDKERPREFLSRMQRESCFRVSSIRLRTYYSGKKHLIPLCTEATLPPPRSLPLRRGTGEGIENRDESRDLISISKTQRGDHIDRIENNERDRYEGNTARWGGQAKGLRAKGDENSKLADRKIHENNNNTE